MIRMQRQCPLGVKLRPRCTQAEVRFTPINGHRQRGAARLISAKTGSQQDHAKVMAACRRP
jgi:hypothetical protein